MSVGFYIFYHAEISQTFLKMGYPAYIIYPLALAKILCLFAIWSNKSETLKEWAYAGFFFNLTLAFFAHFMINDGEFAPVLIAIFLLSASYLAWKKLINAN